MPTHKNLKKVIRARMSKTGESYSTARMRVLANAGKPPADAPTANARPLNAVPGAGIDVAAQQTNFSSHEKLDAANPSQRAQKMLDATKRLESPAWKAVADATKRLESPAWKAVADATKRLESPAWKAVADATKRLESPAWKAVADATKRLESPFAKMQERMNPVPNAMRSILEIEGRMRPDRLLGIDALRTVGLERMSVNPTTRSLPMKVMKNVEPVWNVTGESGPPFAIDVDRSTPHYYIRRVPGTPGGEEVEVHFLGDAEREGVEPDGQLSDGKLVFFYVTTSGHLGQLRREQATRGCYLLKKDGSIWKLIGLEFFEGGDPAVGRLRREMRASESPLDRAKRLLDEGEKDLAAIKVGTELEKQLRALAIHASIPPDHNGTPKKADRLNAELAQAGCYSQLDQKNITAWLDLRNKAAHGHSNAFTAAQVAIMVVGVREFIAKNRV